MSEFYDYTYSNNKKVFFGICSYDGKIHYQTMNSLLKTFSLLQKDNIDYEYNIRCGSHINRLRNELANDFLHSKCDYLIFIDADLYGFEHLILKMIYSNADVIGGVYPKKQFVNDLLNLNIINKKNLFDTSTHFNCNLYDNEIEKIIVENGIIDVKHIGAGCLLIKRSVLIFLENFVDCYKGVSDFFRSYVKDNNYLTEDYGFCQLCIDYKIKVKALIKFPLSHIGGFIYKGSFLEYIEKISIIKKLKSSS